MAHLTKEDRLRIENMLNAGISAQQQKCQEILGSDLKKGCFRWLLIEQPRSKCHFQRINIFFQPNFAGFLKFSL